MLTLRLPLRLATHVAPSQTRVAPSQTRVAASQLANPTPSLTISRAFASRGRPKKSESSADPNKTTTRAKPRASTSKPVKVLTPEEKADLLAKKKEKKAKDHLRELKKAALSPPSHRVLNAWTIYVRENAKGRTSSGIGELSKSLSESFKNIPSREREHYNHLTTEANAKVQREFDEWLLSHTPLQIRDANLARKKLRTKVANKAKYRPIKDNRLVKRPMSTYMHYYMTRLSSGDFQGITALQASKDVSVEFKTLSASEKQKYEDLAVKDMERYRKEYLEVYGTEPLSDAKLAAETAASP